MKDQDSLDASGDAAARGMSEAGTIDLGPSGMDAGTNAPDANRETALLDDAGVRGSKLDLDAAPEGGPGPGEFETRLPDGGLSCSAVPDLAPLRGHSAAAGDFDRDGKADLALGHPADADHAGSVCVVYGAAYTKHAFDQPCQVFYQGMQRIQGPREGASETPPGDHFGMALAAGDVDGDGTSDLVIGAPDETTTEIWQGGDDDYVDERTGLVHILFGTGSKGLNPLGADSLPLRLPQSWDQDSDGNPGGHNSDDDRAGAVLCISDFNGDGASELLISSPGKLPYPDTTPSGKNAGAVMTLAGPIRTINTLTHNGALGEVDFSDADTWPCSNEQSTPAADELFGAALVSVPAALPSSTASRLLLIGAPGESFGLGAVYAWLVDPAKGFDRPVQKAVISTDTSPGSRFGQAIASDGRRVFIGAPGDSNAAGRVYVADLGAVPAVPNLWPKLASLVQPANVADGPEPGDEFGRSLAIQHVTGLDLLLVSAPGERLGDVCDAGIVHRFRLSDLSYYDSIQLDQHRLLGYALGAADFDGDGDEEGFATAPGGVSGGLAIWD